MDKLVKKIRVKYTLSLITGLHVGGNSENVQIGGIDNPVIRTAVKDNQPYIPGSSIKGKMRCLLEQVAGSTAVGGDDEVNNLFGCIKKNQEDNRPSKLIVRDAMLTDESVTVLKECENLDMPYTEGKWENVIDRKKGTAEHPRQTERIPAGVKFNVEFIVNIWDDDKEDEMMKMLEKGISLIENDYLGGSGSRGYGQVKFEKISQQEFSESDNWKGK